MRRDGIAAGRLRLVVVLDDIRRELLISSDLVNALTAYIADSTVFPCLYWFISLADVNYDLVSHAPSKLCIDVNYRDIRHAKQLVRSPNQRQHQEGLELLRKIQRREGPGKRFVEFVTALARNPDVKQREYAFFIVRHTNRTKGRPAEPIDPEFHPLLQEILLDASNQWLAKKFLELFRLNLENFDRIAPVWVLSEL